MKLTALFYFVLSLFGCDVDSSSFVHRSSVDGSDVLYSKAAVHSGVARFECLRSASGECHYTAFPRDCDSATDGAAEATCKHRPIERFAVAQGDIREVAGLVDFRLCVDTGPAVPGPDCEPPQSVAAR